MSRFVEALQEQLVFGDEIIVQLPDTFRENTFLYTRKQDNTGWVGVKSKHAFQAYALTEVQDGMAPYRLAQSVFVRHETLPSQWSLATNEQVLINPSSASGDK